MVSLSATSRICANVHPPTSVSYFTVSVSVLLAIITIPGNILVCLAIVKDPFRNLKTPFNYFLLSLAATDLAVGAIMNPVSVVYHTNEALQLNYVDIKILHVFYFVLSTASILTLAALTVDRYVAIAMPVKYKTTVTSRRAIVTSVSIWVAALGFSFIYFKLGFMFFAFFFANTTVVSTFGILIFVHVGILKRLNERSKYWRGRRAIATDTENQENQDNIISTQKESKAAKLLMIVLLAFSASFTPACVMIYLLNFCLKCSCVMIHWFRDLQFVMVLCNSAINPYLYAWRLPQFKRAFYKILHLRSRVKASAVSAKSAHVVAKSGQIPESRVCGNDEKISGV